jgi:SAM-dependent methyltransferase
MIGIDEAMREFAVKVDSSALVLDVGCGDRPYEQHFSHCRYVGLDVSPAKWPSVYEKRPDVAYDGLNLPFASNTIDHVICTEVLEHCLDPDGLLRQIHRVMKTDGCLFLTVPFMWAQHNLPFDFRRYTMEGIRKQVEGAHFRVTAMDKLTRGRDALNQIVRSEINAHQHWNPDYWSGMGRFARLGFVLWQMAWALQDRLGRGLFDYDRLYLDNLVIAEK